MEPDDEREKPRSVSYIPRPFTSPSEPHQREEAFQLRERARTTVSDDRSRGKPLYPYGKFTSYDEILENMNDEDPFRNAGQASASTDSARPQSRDFLRRGSGHERLREKHERSVAIRKDLVPMQNIQEKKVRRSGDNERPDKHRRTRDKRKVREQPAMDLSGTYTKSYEYTNPGYEMERGGDMFRIDRESEKSNPKGSDRLRRRKKSATDRDDQTSTGTYTLEEKDDQVKLINETKDQTDFGALTEPMEKAFYRKDYIRADKDASMKRVGDTLKKLRVDSRQTGFRSSMSSKHRGVKRTRAALRHFVQTNVKHRQCKHYVQDKQKENMCKCGRDIPWHIEEGIVVNLNNTKDQWDPDMHTKAVNASCYGEVFFNGFGRESKRTCPYVRITTNTSTEVVFRIMSEHWSLPPPKLLISVTGGAKQFHLKKRLNTVFKRGLIDAAKTTSAWIVSGGLNAGVMKVVGEAVKEHQMSSGQAENIVAIGVATWGYVDNLEALEGEDENGAFPATYNIEDLSLRRGCSPLDHNHTHFVLVDNGTERKPGVEIPFRAALEEYVSRKMETVTGVDGDCVSVPVIMLVLEGGMNTLKTAAESLKKNMPVVLIEGSGRAADFMAHGFKMTRGRVKDDGTDFPVDFDERMMIRAADTFDWSRATEKSKEEDIKMAVELLRGCLSDRKLITVYTLQDSTEQSKYIDKAILTALLKANRSNAATQLGLALAWNRCDIARQEIFTPENRPRWQHLHLDNAMFTALVQDRVDFVQLFLDMGVELKRFLTVRRLRDLYDMVLRDKYAGSSRDLLKNLIREIQGSIRQHFFFCCAMEEWKGNSPKLLHTVGSVVQHMMGDLYQNMYAGEKYCVKDNAEDASYKDRAIGHEAGLLTSRSYDTVDGAKHHTRPTLRRRPTRLFVGDFSHPEKELMLWSVLLNRRELALMFWKAGVDHIGSSLMASSLLKNLSEKAADEEEIDLSNDLLKHSQDFEQIALGVLTECYNTDKMKTHLALIRTLDKLGGSTCLSIADTGEHMEFMGNTACQTRLNKIWKGNMALYTSTWKILVACFFPFIIPWIKFTRGDSGLGKVLGYKDEHSLFVKDQRVEPSSEDILESGALEVAEDNSDDDGDDGNDMSRRTPKKLFTVSFSGRTDSRTKRINICRAILYFYSAPITKFLFTAFSYIIFLAIFSYFCLTNLYPTSHPNSPSNLEILIWCWAGTLIVEEIRQVMTKDPRSIQYKLQGWFSQTWNKADLIMYSLFIVSVVLRFALDGRSFQYARTAYAVTLALCYLRFMQSFYVNKDIGPKVIMINRMLYDVAFFIAIFAVFILCYGVATQMLLYPNSLPNWELLKNVVYLPYWQMYGELFLERVEAEKDLKTCSSNRTVWVNDAKFKQCPESNAAAPFMFALYMLMTNVLLLNLLIAMFSYTFQKVQDNSELVWRYYRCSLFYEFFDRPTLAAPLIIFSHIYRFFRYIIKLCCKQDARENNDFRVCLSEEDNDKVTEFEKLAMNNYLIKADRQERELINNRVANTGDRLERVIDELEEIKDNMVVKESKGDEDDNEIKKEESINLGVDPMEEVDALHDRLASMEERLDIQGEQMQQLISLMHTMIQENKKARSQSGRSVLSDYREHVETPESRDQERRGHGLPHIEIRDPRY